MKHFFQGMGRILVGRPLDPLDPRTRHSLALVAFLAWVGLGADGLSSSAYGPEEAFRALGEHSHLGLWLVIATAVTVFVIALAYNQVIELFPSGGGGYKAATKLIGPYAGLVSGSALIIDYVLTITISVAAGVDAIFSFLPRDWLSWKLPAQVLALLLLLGLNLRGMKESIRVLLPLFLGFFVSHLFLIVYGIYHHVEVLDTLFTQTVQETHELAGTAGWMFTIALLLKAYSLGGGTYTGLEAVSNNVNMLAEPRVRTGHLTMLYMALSLAFVASGILLLYLLWDAKPVHGQTLNAVTFGMIIDSFGFEDPGLSHGLLVGVLVLEACLLFVGANTGFLGGPAVLANMAADRWVPRQFRQLSSRLVTQNGVLLMGAAALAVLLWSRGSVHLLVVLYSINVFITFTLAMAGLCRHWLDQRRFMQPWRRSFLLSALGFVVCAFILLVTLVEKFAHGGWVTLLITGSVAGLGLMIHRHYEGVAKQMALIENHFAPRPTWDIDAENRPEDKAAPTAVFLVGSNRGAAMVMLEWARKQFPERFRNYLFVSVGEVDKQSFDGSGAIKSLQVRIDNSLRYLTSYCASRGLRAASYQAYGNDPLQELSSLLEQVLAEYPDSLCFASQLMFEHDHAMTRFLHNQMPLAMQRQLSLRGKELVIVPLRVPEIPEDKRERFSTSR
ncbi:APC family permease [Solimonas sp. SE-A11]|uniref:APC family permease n=1 Tax=Solimonas sp. SE-A11 TaxID=3054954 RepID=UPI00259C694C|nr:APC family permease [Solimonas sp. SE-A11]MDM4772473.1 APC family permease [Solimonas sp. SE-A11]